MINKTEQEENGKTINSTPPSTLDKDVQKKRSEKMNSRELIGIIIGALFIGYATKSIIGAIVGGFLGYYFVRESNEWYQSFNIFI